MSFYITLDSNVKSIESLHSSKLSEFRTTLGRHLSLEGEWVVGLSEVTYTKSWYNVLHPHRITLFDELGNIYGDQNMTEEFTISEGYYDTSIKLINSINKILTKLSSIKPPSLQYNELNNKITLQAGKTEGGIKVYPDLGDEIENILGLKNRNLKNDVYSLGYSSIHEFVFGGTNTYREEKFEAFHPVEITGGYHSLFLYTDIVYPSLIGDTCSQILRVIEIPRKCKFGDTVHINYDQPHYRELLLNELSNIEIKMTDDTGQLVPFKFGRLSLTLHFKKL